MAIITYALTMLFILYGLYLLKKERIKIHEERIASIFNPQRTAAVEGPFQEEQLNEGLSKRIFQPLWTKMRRLFKQRTSDKKFQKLEVKLEQAGNPMNMNVVEFRIAKVAVVIVITAVFSLLGFAAGGTVMAISFYGLVGFAISQYVPVLYLKSKTADRKKSAVKELPDFLDLLTVSIEAGLGFDSALSKVVAKKEGTLSKEFQRCLEEIRLGKTRREALTGVKKRLNVDDIHAFIGSIIQAEQLGIGMVQVLRIQSDEVRARRKQRAEEQAMKAPIKMMFPLVLFIFPGIFIILLGPAVIQILETF